MPIFRDRKAPVARGRKQMPSLGGSTTASSVVVTPERSMQVATVYAAVRLLSESVSTLPVGIYTKDAGYRVRAEDHQLASLLLEEPNYQIDSTEYWRTMMGWQLLRGNAYAYVERNGAGRPIRLWPIAPTSVDVKQSDTGRMIYELTPDADSEYVPVKSGYKAQRHEILHYRAFGLGLQGLSPIAMARQQIGTSFAATSYIGGFFARDASPGGMVTVPNELSDKSFERMKEQWNSLHEGFDKAHRLAILEGGASWEKTTLSPADAQFLEVYKMTRQDIAAIYGVPPHKIGDLERATFSNIEQQSLEYVTDSLLPWLVRMERVTKQLFSDKGTYLKFNTDGLLRGDTKTRHESYRNGRQWGYYSANDIRRMEDLDPIDDPSADKYLTPMNMTAGDETKEPEPGDSPIPEPPVVEPTKEEGDDTDENV